MRPHRKCFKNKGNKRRILSWRKTRSPVSYTHLDVYKRQLSGGESQRIRLATQIGSALTGVLYVLDEPSIGLHQRDNSKLIATLKLSLIHIFWAFRLRSIRMWRKYWRGQGVFLRKGASRRRRYTMKSCAVLCAQRRPCVSVRYATRPRRRSCVTGSWTGF